MTLEEIGLAVVRIEGKLDLLGSRSSTLETNQFDHEQRIRGLEAKSSSMVTSKMLWSTIIGASTVVGVISQIIYYASGH